MPAKFPPSQFYGFQVDVFLFNSQVSWGNPVALSGGKKVEFEGA